MDSLKGAGVLKSAPSAVLLPSGLLTAVLYEACQIHQLVVECHEELAEVNAGLKSDVFDPKTSSAVQSALLKNEAVEVKVAAVEHKMAAVKLALNGQLRERLMLDHQFAAAVEQGAAARHIALHDVLTGLPNRALFEDRLAHGLEQARRHGRSIAVMFMDLDGFKRINDRFGHACGDRVLQLVARRLSANARSMDTISRYGGDEFVYLLTEVKDESSAGKVAEKLIEALHAPCEWDADAGPAPVIRASVGIAIFPQHGDTAEMLMRSADTAMYKAKQSRSGHAFAV